MSDVATASYWVVSSDRDGNPNSFMWNCESCPAVGVSRDEAGAIEAMNAHVVDDHPDSEYVPVVSPDETPAPIEQVGPDGETVLVDQEGNPLPAPEE